MKNEPKKPTKDVLAINTRPCTMYITSGIICIIYAYGSRIVSRLLL